MISLLKRLGWIGTLIAAGMASAWAYVTYEDQTRIAFRRPMVERTIDLCFEASDIAGRLVGEPDEKLWEQHRGDFWRLYYGKLVIIENQTVAGAMVGLGQAVKTAEFTSRSSLGSGALAVSGACREQIGELMDKGWRLDLAGLIHVEDVLKGYVTK